MKRLKSGQILAQEYFLLWKESPKEGHQFQDWDAVVLKNNYSFALKYYCKELI